MSRRLNEAKPEKKKNKTKQNKIRELPLANIGTLETRGQRLMFMVICLHYTL